MSRKINLVFLKKPGRKPTGFFIEQIDLPRRTSRMLTPLSRLMLGMSALLAAAGGIATSLIALLRGLEGVGPHPWPERSLERIQMLGCAGIFAALAMLGTAFTLWEQAQIHRRRADIDVMPHREGNRPARTSRRERNAMLIIVALFFIARLRAGFRGGGGVC